MGSNEVAQREKVVRKKVVFLGAPFEVYKGGSEYQYSQLEKVLSPSCDIYYLFRHKHKLADPRYITYDYKLRRRYNRLNYSDAHRIYELLKGVSPDIIYKRGGNYIFGIGVFYANKNNRKFIWHIAHENDVVPYRPAITRHCIRELVDKAIIKFGIQNADVIVGQAKYQNDLLNAGFNRSCDFIIPNFHPMPNGVSHKKEGAVRVLWVANIKPFKQPQIFIHLARRLSNEPCKFIMVGRPAKRSWQRELEREMIKVKNLDYLGELANEDVNALLEESHILVNTSENEGFPNTFIQAWMRKVVPVSLYVNPDDVFTTHRVGVCSKSIDKLVDDVRDLIHDERLRNEIADAGYKYAVENHVIERNVDKIMKIFGA